MNFKKVLPWVLGTVIAVSGIGFVSVKAAEETPHKEHMQQERCKEGKQMEKMDHSMMKDGKHAMDPAMMEKCMKDQEMMKMCMEMMQKPEMQGMLKEMMQKDAKFHKMMLDLVNSVEMPEGHDMEKPIAHRMDHK